jgi:hypothetical protein
MPGLPPGSIVATVKRLLRQDLGASFTPEIRSERQGGAARDGIGVDRILAELGEMPEAAPCAGDCRGP